MDVFRVSDGAYERNKLDFAAFDSWHDVLVAVSGILDIPVEHVVLFREDGRQLDEAMFHGMWEQAGEWRGKGEVAGGVYVFDREAFSADPEEWVRGLEEDVVLEMELPLRPLRSAHLANQTLAPFLASLAQIHALEARLGVQRNGLRIAGGNLVEHAAKLIDGDGTEGEGDEERNRTRSHRPGSPHTTDDDNRAPLTRGWSAFQHLVETELERELSLIGPYSPPPTHPSVVTEGTSLPGKGWGMEQDMHVISGIEVHDVFKRSTAAVKTHDKDKGTARRSSNVAGSPTTTASNVPPPSQGMERAPSATQERRKLLKDYVNFARMKVVRDNCRRLYDDHQVQYSTISNDVFTLQSATDQIARSIEGLEAEVEGEVVELLGHAEGVVDEARLLVLEDPDVHWQSLRSLDATMRELVVAMTHLKNDFCLQLHIHLHSIAIQQSSIAHITSTMSELETALTATRTGSTGSGAGKAHPTGFTHLDRLRNMLSAYMTACVEMVWRKQLAEVLEVKSSGLTEALAGFLEAERRRRRGFEQGEVAVLPPDINVFARQAGGTASGTGTGDRGTPDFEFSVKAGYEELDVRAMTREDVEALLATVESMKQDPALAPYIDPPDGVLDRAITKARNLIEDMDLSLLQLESLWSDRPSTQITSRESSPDIERERLANDFAALQLSHARLQDQVRENRDTQEPEMDDRLHALEQEMAALQVELNHRQNAHEQDIARMQQLEVDRSQLLKGLSDARNDEEDLAMKLQGIQAEKDAVMATLEDVMAERDQLAKDHADQIETMVETRLGELQGNKEQLREQNAALLDEMEKLKAAHKSQMDNLQNRQAREVDGLKAELGMAKAQLKESQKAKVELLQNLSDVRSDLAAAKEESASASRFSLASIKLASKYHDCVARLHTAIQSSATISGSTSALLKTQETTEDVSKDADDQSLLQQELGVLDEYDLDAFTDAVNRTMSLVKKWQKSCRSYRDRAKDKLAFSNFGKGDLALFLPTRNATAKSWAAFNISSPHHFLDVRSHPSLEEQVKSREWIVARITKIDVDVVNTSVRPDSNPFGLAEGITYYSLSVEPFTPSTGRLRRSSSGSKMPAMSTPGALLTTRTPPVKGSDYFGPLAARVEAQHVVPVRDVESRASVNPRRPSSVASSQGSNFSKKGKGIQYGSSKAASTLAVSGAGNVGVDHHLGAGGEGNRPNRRSFTERPVGDGDVAGRPTMHPQLRPGSFSRRVASAGGEADPAAGMGQGALDILKRIEAERGEKKG